MRKNGERSRVIQGSFAVLHFSCSDQWMIQSERERRRRRKEIKRKKKWIANGKGEKKENEEIKWTELILMQSNPLWIFHLREIFTF